MKNMVFFLTALTSLYTTIEVRAATFPVNTELGDAPSIVSASPVTNKTMNLRFNALAAAAEVVEVAADFRLSDKFTFGPQLWYSQWHDSLVDTKYAASARANYMITGQSLGSGLYLSGYVMFVEATISSYQLWLPNGTVRDNTFAAGSGIGAGALLGYQWVSHSGFNVSVGAGYGDTTLKTVQITDPSGAPGASIGNSTGAGILGGIKAEVSLGYVL